jgi:OmpA-OmpF porin, OOP family
MGSKFTNTQIHGYPLMRLLFSILYIVLPLFAISAQDNLSTKNRRAAELYQESENYMVRRQYNQVISLLNQAVSRDSDFAEAHFRLGQAHKAQSNKEKALFHFDQVLRMQGSNAKFSAAWFQKGDLLFKYMQYEEAIAALEYYEKLAPKGEHIKENKTLLASAKFAKEAIQNPVNFDPKPLSNVVNAFALQYFPVLTADEQTLFFTARNGNARGDDEDIFVSQKNQFGEWGRPESISPTINTIYNEGTCTITGDGRTMIFTACEGRSGYGSCDLYISFKVGNQWTKPENLGPNINTSHWESQPSLSADGRRLYFVSNRPGGLGLRDIYYSDRYSNGQWAPAKNLGAPINTEADEVSPFIHANGEILFFSSNGHPGFGGYDLFYSTLEKSKFSLPVNLGYPINTSEDQVSLFITASGTQAYYANEKKEGNIYVESKLYTFPLPPQLQVVRSVNFVKGKVVDAITQKPITAQIELIDLETDELASVVSSDSISGEYLITLSKGSEYALYISKGGYLFDSRYFSYQEGDDVNPVMADILLHKIERGKSVNLNNLFFDFDKFELRDKSKTELNKIISFLHAYPELKIEIEGHTDNVGSDEYNLNLSKQRALSVYTYLLKSGIPEQRLSFKGYGKNNPIADNDSEAGRQSNRRIAFKIL